MTVAEKIAVVERYIKERKGVDVAIIPPDTVIRAHLLERAYAVAKHWNDTRQPR